MPPDPADIVRVWDPALRAFHWLLVLCAAIALLTGFVAPQTRLRPHLFCGCAIAVLLGSRFVWGLLGGTYARFTSFAYRPRTVLSYLRALVAGSAPRHLGHNPLGSTMIYALLTVLTAILVSGVVALGGVVKEGPLRAFVGFDAASFWLSCHNVLAVLLSVMIGAHVGGVLLESRRTSENLVAAMVSGRKAADGAVPATPVAGRPWLAGAILAGLIAAASAGIAHLSRLPARGVPPATLDPTYTLQCGACHMAYPPSLAPAASWRGLLADLQHHFGADASLSPDLVGHIGMYLLANSAEHWDTLAAHMLRKTDPAAPSRITATPFWQEMHSAIPPSVFASPRVVRKSACDACHHDAETGRFAPQAIDVPY